MKDKLKGVLIALAAIAALAVGGAAIAGAAGGSDDDATEKAITGSALERASAVALKETGGGKVNQTELDNENGATYEVEVTTPDGSTVDVRLDDRFAVVVVEGDSEKGE